MEQFPHPIPLSKEIPLLAEHFVQVNQIRVTINQLSLNYLAISRDTAASRVSSCFALPASLSFSFFLVFVGNKMASTAEPWHLPRPCLLLLWLTALDRQNPELKLPLPLPLPLRLCVRLGFLVYCTAALRLPHKSPFLMKWAVESAVNYATGSR